MIQARRQSVFVYLFMALVSLKLAHSIRIAWMQFCGRCYVPGAPPVPGTAPEAYRVAAPFLLHAMMRLLHRYDPPLVQAGIDFVFCFATLVVGAHLVTRSLRGDRRWGGVVLFLALIQVPLANVVEQQRPETMMTSFFVVLAMWCTLEETCAWTATLVLVSVLQAFCRADVPMVYGAALIVAGCVWRASRARNLVRGACVVAVTGAVQAYLQFVAHPNLPYSTGSPIVFVQNLRSDHLVPCLLALVPVVLALTVLPHRFGPVDRVVLIAAAMYVPVWFTVGIVAEVRIFVPFLMALCAVAARAYVEHSDAREMCIGDA